MDKLNLKSKFDIFAGFAILGIVLMIIIPLPPFALDILLSVNIACLLYTSDAADE